MATQPTNLPVPSESPRDLKFNAGKIDEFVTSMALQYIDRFGNTHYTIEGLKQLVLNQIYNLGLIPIGTFQDGAIVTAAGDIIQDTSTGVWYRWDDLSTLPKTVPSGSTPDTTGGVGDGKWLAVDVSDVLRKELANGGGDALIRHVRPSIYDGTLNDYFSATYKEVNPDEFSGLSTDTLRLQSAINSAGKVQLKKKQYTITSSITCDFSSSTYPILSRESSRFDIIGVGIHSSVLNFNGSFVAFDFLGNSTWSAHGTNSVMSLKDFCIYGTGNTGTGIRFNGFAHMRVENLRVVRCNTGIRITECTSNYFDKLYVDNCNTGVLIDGVSLTNNATHLSGNFSSCSTYALDAAIGTVFSISNSIFEHNGTTGVASSGDIRIRLTQPMAVATIDNVYFGFSNGGANIRIDNTTASTVIVRIVGGMITRGGPNGEQTTSNISITSSGGGRVMLELDGVTFYTNSSWGYSPSQDRPFIDDGGVTIIKGMDTCFFNEQTSKKVTAKGSSGVFGGSVYGPGDGEHPQFLSSTKTATGVYKLTSSIPLSNTISGYQVTAISQGLSVRVGYITKTSVTEFTIFMFNTSGVAADGTFDYQISMSR